jgi:hypothetical protein
MQNYTVIKYFLLKHHTVSKKRNFTGYEEYLMKIVLKIEAAVSSISVNLNQTIRRHVPEHNNTT